MANEILIPIIHSEDKVLKFNNEDIRGVGYLLGKRPVRPGLKTQDTLFQQVRNTRNVSQKIGLWLINLMSRAGRYRLTRNIAYGTENRNLLDYYQTYTPGESNPLVLFFYGGNWSAGRKEDYRFVADTLCRYGFDVVIPDYRLYPDVRFDAILDDAVKASRWVLRECGDQPVMVMGHSAGAQLGSLICLNKALLVDADLDPNSESRFQRIQGFLGLAGPYDFYPFSEDFYYDLFAPAERYPESQPVNFVRQDGPPMYLLHGKEDMRVRRGHSKSLMEKVRSAGGMAEREVYENTGHVDIILSFAPLLRRNSAVIADVMRFLKEYAV